MNFYLYREFMLDAKKMRATADGRRNGELYAMGICPTRFHLKDPLFSMVGSLSALNMDKSVMQSVNIMLPAGEMDTDTFVSLLRGFASAKLKHMQINCVDMETLEDARVHPEDHQDLVVRVCGFSAKFVSLSPQWQDEFMTRIKAG